MEPKNVKYAVYEFVNKACKELDYWIVSMYETNHFVLMDNRTESVNDYTLETLEKELRAKSSVLSLELEVKNQAVENNYVYVEEDLV